MKKLERKIGDVADEFLEAILLAEQSGNLQSELSGGRYDLAKSAIWACDFHLVDAVLDEIDGGGRYFLLPDDASDATRTFWPIDIGMCARKEDHLLFTRVCSAEPRDVRGLVKMVPPKIITATACWIADRVWDAETYICGAVGGRWKVINNPVQRCSMSSIGGGTLSVIAHYPKERDEEVTRTATLAFAARLSARYDWHVAFGFNNTGPRLVIPTNPTGCLELFKSRDLESGERRRKALRHWVNEHYRDRSNDPSQLDYIREHLRGNTQFVWNGLACELMVSEYDLEKNEFFKVQAAEWRAMRKHNRVRLRLKSRRSA